LHATQQQKLTSVSATEIQTSVPSAVVHSVLPTTATIISQNYNKMTASCSWGAAGMPERKSGVPKNPTLAMSRDFSF